MWSHLRLLTFCAACAACASQAEAPGPPPPAAPSSCVTECERSQQMRAVAAEVITQECEARCAGDAG
ncbi:MAG: hypothetical protein IPG45_37100 [Deltaproteobacteria bacterium]|nr:hypothetical protein [Deltaproteobacteria bacterium]